MISGGVPRTRILYVFAGFLCGVIVARNAQEMNGPETGAVFLIMAVGGLLLWRIGYRDKREAVANAVAVAVATAVAQANAKAEAIAASHSQAMAIVNVGGERVAIDNDADWHVARYLMDQELQAIEMQEEWEQSESERVRQKTQ